MVDSGRPLTREGVAAWMIGAMALSGDTCEPAACAAKLIDAYLHATNEDDREALRRLVTAQFQLVRGGRTMRGIDNVMALERPEHVRTHLSLLEVTIDGESFLATIEQHVSWLDSDEPPDTRRVRARFSFTCRLISRVELLG